jgi:hypothetical protein
LFRLNDLAKRHAQPLARLRKRLGLLGAVEGLQHCTEVDAPQKFEERRGLPGLDAESDLDLFGD